MRPKRPQPSRRTSAIHPLAFWGILAQTTFCKAHPSAQMISSYLHSPRSGWKGWLRLGQTTSTQSPINRPIFMVQKTLPTVEDSRIELEISTSLSEVNCFKGVYNSSLLRPWRIGAIRWHMHMTYEPSFYEQCTCSMHLKFSGSCDLKTYGRCSASPSYVLTPFCLLTHRLSACSLEVEASTFTLKTCHPMSACFGKS